MKRVKIISVIYWLVLVGLVLSLATPWGREHGIKVLILWLVIGALGWMAWQITKPERII